MRKAIFITGAASGIGRAVAQRFAREGWVVGLADIDMAGLDATAALLPAGASHRYRLDVRDRDQWAAALADFGTASGGRLDVLVNNAGIGVGGPFAEVPHAETDRLIAVNFNGVVHGIESAFDLLRATPGSAILNTGSASGIYGAAGLAVYSATKFAVRGLTEALDIEFARFGIKVRSLMPSFIETPLLDQGVAGSNRRIRDTVTGAGLEITPVADVADAAWAAVHGDRVHVLVGKTARRLAFLARWAPGMITRRSRSLDRAARGGG